METTLERIFQNSLSEPNKIALISEGEKITYAQLVLNISKASSFLNSKGVKEGDKVLLSALKELKFVYLYFATHLLGGITVVVDSESKASRIEYITSKTQPKFIFGNFAKGVKYEKLTFPNEDIYFTKRLANVNVNKPCDILFTTGTTGNPKGVVLTAFNELHAAININEFIGNTKDDIEMLALPLSHSFGLGRMRCTLFKGATLLLFGSFVNIRQVFDAFGIYHVSGFGMVPSVWSYIKRFSGRRIGQYAEQIKYIEIGSSPMSIEDKHLLMELFPNTRICMHYGLTEASRSAFIEFHSFKDNLDSIGKSAPNVKIKIIDEEGKECPIGVEGEVCVKGNHVMSGYLEKGDNINAFWSDYFRTGDWGVKSSNGLLYLRGRKKEIINVGGEKVAPIEVEEFLNGMPQISECACVAAPDPTGILGEVVKVYVVPSNSDIKLTIKDIRNYLFDKVETYKIPAILQMIDKLPQTDSGKIQRLKLK